MLVGRGNHQYHVGETAAVSVPYLTEEAGRGGIHFVSGVRVVVGGPGRPGADGLDRMVGLRHHRAAGGPLWHRPDQQRAAVTGEIVALGAAEELLELGAGEFLFPASAEEMNHFAMVVAG